MCSSHTPCISRCVRPITPSNFCHKNHGHSLAVFCRVPYDCMNLVLSSCHRNYKISDHSRICQVQCVYLQGQVYLCSNSLKLCSNLYIRRIKRFSHDFCASTRFHSIIKFLNGNPFSSADSHTLANERIGEIFRYLNHHVFYELAKSTPVPGFLGNLRNKK